MNNDLISREALKNEFALMMWKEYSPYMEVKVCDIVNQTLDFIDNAPTVPLPDFKAGYKQAIIDGKTNFSRPTGEWILQKYERFNSGNELYKYYCNKCGHKEEHAYSDSKLPNFCEDCGADMRGN